MFLNVLVGVICNSYDGRWEKRQYYGLQQRNKMYADFIHLINFEKGLKKPFIYVVEPVGRDEEEAEVESSTDVLQA